MSIFLHDRSLSANTADENQKIRMKQSLEKVDSLLKEVQYDWKNAIYEDSNPLDIALPLLDNTSVGLAHRRGDFLELKSRISNGLKAAVNEHFQSFNESIGSYRAIVHNITSSQDLVKKIKDNVTNTAQFLQNDDLHSVSMLNQNLKNYNDMISILNAISELKKLSNEVENEINLRNYAKAQALLQSANKIGQEHRLWELPALGNLKEFFETQEGQLFELLVEELHSVIYSKKIFDTFNNHSTDFTRRDGSQDYSSIEKFLVDTIDIDISESALSNQAKLDEFLKFISEKNATDDFNDEADLSELSILDETNPFNQILNILTILYKQGKLQLTIQIVVQRLATEFNQLVNRIIEDTKLRHAKIVKALNATAVSNLTGKQKLMSRLGDDGMSSVVIQDLFWNFFKKLLFLHQSIKVIVVVNRKFEGSNPDSSHFVLNRDENSADSVDFKPHKTYEGSIDLTKLWEIVQQETRSLILTYISTSDSTDPVTYSATSKQSNTFFQFANIEYDQERTTQMKSILEDMFPGFINSSDMTKIDSPYIEDNKFLKQPKIIPSTILNMRYILEPFLIFVQGVTLLVNNFAESPLKFFNDFMTEEFLPLLQDAFLWLYNDEVTSLNSLEIFDYTSLDIPYSQEFGSQEPSVNDPSKTDKIFYFVVRFKLFLNNICFVLNTSLQFRREISNIIFKIFEEFHKKVEELHQDLYNEVISHLEADSEIKSAVQNLNKPLTSAIIQKTPLNKIELRNSKVFFHLRVFRNSLKFLINLAENHLIKNIDLKKTDLNLTDIEKLRKNWSFFEIINIKNDVFQDNEATALSFENINKIILDDELRIKYDSSLADLKRMDSSVEHIIRILDQVSNV